MYRTDFTPGATQERGSLGGIPLPVRTSRRCQDDPARAFISLLYLTVSPIRMSLVCQSAFDIFLVFYIMYMMLGGCVHFSSVRHCRVVRSHKEPGNGILEKGEDVLSLSRRERLVVVVVFYLQCTCSRNNFQLILPLHYCTRQKAISSDSYTVCI
jgi:hypothetical protein